MELKSFVTQALVEIVEAVADAQEKTNKTGAIINPRKMFYTGPTSGNRIAITIPGTADEEFYNREGQIVEFDVSVTASESDEAQGGVGIQVASLTLGFGVSGKTQDQNSVISRLKFSVPVFLPEDKK